MNPHWAWEAGGHQQIADWCNWQAILTRTINQGLKRKSEPGFLSFGGRCGSLDGKSQTAQEARQGVAVLLDCRPQGLG
eukprot:CAMPEP_0183462724 /NCGR_PEP_ID=MMETSP0370-20130417/142221_1 /TAXON_ID=268820 /ORGANISM="Peridinium aciculiferum, Strain PAER-2" /LENGTH=77 /DNA_ID=CAMNT_0025654771 /DNA_START=42 /DNA_END=272 /DNA_ORIENTATION=-